MHGIVHFILNLLEKQPCGRRIAIVVYGCGINVCEFLVKAAFTQTDFTYLCKQVLKIVLCQ